MNGFDLARSGALARVEAPDQSVRLRGLVTAWSGARAFVRGRPLLVFTPIVAVGLAAGWVWFGAAILPLLYALPCAVMMVMCMKGHGASNTPANGGVAGTQDTMSPQ